MNDAFYTDFVQPVFSTTDKELKDLGIAGEIAKKISSGTEIELITALSSTLCLLSSFFSDKYFLKFGDRIITTELYSALVSSSKFSRFDSCIHIM